MSRSRVKREAIHYFSDLFQISGLCNLRDPERRQKQAEGGSGRERHGVMFLVEHVMPREQQNVEENH